LLFFLLLALIYPLPNTFQPPFYIGFYAASLDNYYIISVHNT